ncbi:S-norcoclaurine synthase 1 [Sesbania bispinosa]|nr:S-norcoclaurine synthase 1 [Sesbania bispinosa]
MAQDYEPSSHTPQFQPTCVVALGLKPPNNIGKLSMLLHFNKGGQVFIKKYAHGSPNPPNASTYLHSFVVP